MDPVKKKESIMNEKEKFRAFYDCVRRDDFPGCLEALEKLSAEAINRQDDDGYDMLIEAVVAGSECAVEALLQDGRCDWSNREYLCGMTAEEFSRDYPEDSGIRLAFVEEAPGKIIFRNGRVIPREEIFQQIMNGELEADEGCLDMLPDHLCVELVQRGKVAPDVWDLALEIRPELAEALQQAADSKDPAE